MIMLSHHESDNLIWLIIIVTKKKEVGNKTFEFRTEELCALQLAAAQHALGNN